MKKHRLEKAKFNMLFIWLCPVVMYIAIYVLAPDARTIVLNPPLGHSIAWYLSLFISTSAMSWYNRQIDYSIKVAECQECDKIQSVETLTSVEGE